MPGFFMISAIVDTLRTYRSPALHGWVIARLSVTAEPGQPGIVLTGRAAVITGYLPREEAWLRVTLVPGTEGRQSASEPVGSFRISREELAEYLAFSGDDNPIHTGGQAILPALLLLQEVFRQSAVLQRYEARFLMPAFAGEGIFLSQDGPVMLARNAAGEALLRITPL
ncbi:MAG: hypothetical protein J7576_05255 [Siphonobacter aquaeclarae]|nr:hypothetical protein [Siphonobacter aquaeclarae]